MMGHWLERQPGVIRHATLKPSVDGQREQTA
jgi:hypothetical protein